MKSFTRAELKQWLESKEVISIYNALNRSHLTSIKKRCEVSRYSQPVQAYYYQEAIDYLNKAKSDNLNQCKIINTKQYKQYAEKLKDIYERIRRNSNE